MRESFNLYELIADLLRRWRLIAAACGAAALLAVALSLLSPKQYTAVSRIVIEPAAGTDARASMVVSPQYLESLKTYEHFVSGDSLFRKALDHFGLRSTAPQRSIESWKRRVLQVGMVRNTKVMEIAVTLPDPTKAQAMAQFLASGAIEAGQALNRESYEGRMRLAEANLESSAKALKASEEEWSRLARTEPLEPVEAEVQTLEALLHRIDRTLLNAEMRDAAGPPEKTASLQVQVLKTERKRAEESMAVKTALVAQRTALHGQAEARRGSAASAYEAARRQQEAARASAGFGEERLRLIDPGIVPEEPSSPGMRVYLAASILFALAASTLYITFSFAFRLGRGNSLRELYSVRRANDD